SLLHDLSKASARENGTVSHSYLMSNAPEEAVREAMDVLDEAQVAGNFRSNHLNGLSVTHLYVALIPLKRG
ncbi:MAG: hypothetical protein M1305_00125, partial [Candidatus Marsarchaeota archaeon]|nr:hypothetical protein [Candidatus Marsarchaeota archaeon]